MYILVCIYILNAERRVSSTPKLCCADPIKGIACGYWRNIGSVEALSALAKAAHRPWIKSLPRLRAS